MTEPTRTYLGTISLDAEGQALGLNIPANATAAEISAAIEAAKVAAAIAESKRLRELFHLQDGTGPQP
jgi:hypothetical protein